MTPEERQLITGLFDRMRGFGTPEKDKDAEAVINERMRSTPDAPYMLVQSVLVQEQALQQAEQRIRELENQVRDFEEVSPARAQTSSGSFLGGLFGGGRPASQPTGTSVPPIGSRAGSFPSGMDRQGPGAYAAPPPQQPAASGGFMRSAMATAAGVAGGMLAAGAIRDLMGGGNANASTAGANKDGAASGADNASQQQAGNADAGNVQNARDDQAGKGADDAGYEEAYDSGDSGWDDGGDFEI